jgi:pimeloyl-ACP methyl ester carboxylesterase
MLLVALLAAAHGPLPAKKIDVGDYRLKMIRKGQGEPTVVFDSGLGDSHEVWRWVWPEVARFTAVLLYDRAGLGRSDPGPQPRTSEQMVRELRALLRKAKVDPPYILVGHSLGGMNTRLFAIRYPDEVAGLVLVDATPLDFPDWFLDQEVSRRRMDSLASVARAGSRQEYEAIARSAAEVGDAGPFPDLPVIVISSSRPEESPSFQKRWTTMQRQLAQSVGAEQHITTDKSSHYIQYDAPGLVIGAIRNLVRRASD